MNPAAARGPSDRTEQHHIDSQSVDGGIDGGIEGDRNRRILDVIRSLRDGEVVTYGEIADDAGFPKMSRLVGRLLAVNTDADLPWWRVVNSTGRLVPGNEREQVALLKAEGVTCENGRVRTARYGRFSRRLAVRPAPSHPAGLRQPQPNQP